MLGTGLAAAAGFVIGMRGSIRSALLGFALAALIAVAQFVAIHPGGLYASSQAWPWGAASLVLYVLALGVGVVVSLRR